MPDKKLDRAAFLESAQKIQELTDALDAETERVRSEVSFNQLSDDDLEFMLGSLVPSLLRWRVAEEIRDRRKRA